MFFIAFFTSLTVVMKEIFIFVFIAGRVVGSDVGLDVVGTASIKVVSTEAATPFDTTFHIKGDSINNNHCGYMQS